MGYAGVGIRWANLGKEMAPGGDLGRVRTAINRTQTHGMSAAVSALIRAREGTSNTMPEPPGYERGALVVALQWTLHAHSSVLGSA